VVSQFQEAVVRIFIGLVNMGIRGMDADKSGDAHQAPGSFRGHGPQLEVDSKSRVLLEILRRGLLASLTSEGVGTDQSGDVCCQRRRRVSAGFFPAFLRSDWPVMDKIAGRFQDHRIRVKVLKSLGLMQAPGQNNGECGLIQLDATPWVHR